MKGAGELEIRSIVKERYSKLATTPETGKCCGEDDGCCGGSSRESRDTVPAEASSINAGCGSPMLLVTPKPGETVLDLGSGGCIDVFRASQLVGPGGRAIGVDATPEMIWRARATREKYVDKYSNTEFRLGEIECLPIASDSVDYVISNCVINLSPDKSAVFREAFRVLKRGGMFAVADVTLDTEIPETEKKNMDSWSACVSGGLTEQAYRSMLEKAGFEDVSIEHVSSSNIGKFSFEFHSSHIKARKK